MDWNNINRDRDTSGLGPIEYDRSQVPQLIRKYADNVRTKTYGQEGREAQARNAEYAGLIADEARTDADAAHALSTDTQNRFNDQMAGNTDINEVLDARRPINGIAYSNLNERLTNISISVNVKDFGAVGDGVTDDSDAIQFAIDNYENVFLPETHEIKKTITLRRGVTIFGVKGKTVVTSSVPDLTLFVGSDNVTEGTDFAHGIIEGITFKGGRKELNQTGLDLSSYHGSLRDLTVREFGTGILGDGVTFSFDNLYIIANDIGFRLRKVPTFSTMLTFTKVTFHTNRIGFYSPETPNNSSGTIVVGLWFKDSVFENSSERGLEIASAYNGGFDHCWFEGNALASKVPGYRFEFTNIRYESGDPGIEFNEPIDAASKDYRGYTERNATSFKAKYYDLLKYVNGGPTSDIRLGVEGKDGKTELKLTEVETGKVTYGMQSMNGSRQVMKTIRVNADGTIAYNDLGSEFSITYNTTNNYYVINLPGWRSTMPLIQVRSQFSYGNNGGNGTTLYHSVLTRNTQDTSANSYNQIVLKIHQKAIDNSNETLVRAPFELTFFEKF